MYENLGAFYGVDYGEDWEMWVRIARHYPVAYTPQVLAAYRLHAASISGRSYASAKNLERPSVGDTNHTAIPAGNRKGKGTGAVDEILCALWNQNSQ